MDRLNWRQYKLYDTVPMWKASTYQGEFLITADIKPNNNDPIFVCEFVSHGNNDENTIRLTKDGAKKWAEKRNSEYLKKTHKKLSNQLNRLKKYI